MATKHSARLPGQGAAACVATQAGRPAPIHAPICCITPGSLASGCAASLSSTAAPGGPGLRTARRCPVRCLLRLQPAPLPGRPCRSSASPRTGGSPASVTSARTTSRPASSGPRCGLWAVGGGGYWQRRWQTTPCPTAQIAIGLNLLPGMFGSDIRPRLFKWVPLAAAPLAPGRRQGGRLTRLWPAARTT